MAHMVDRMVYAGEVPWHGLGIPLPAQCDGDTLRQLVFDWHAVEQPVLTPGWVAQGLPGYKALVRSDTGEALCVVPASYGVVQYSEALSLLDAAVGEHVAGYVTAGTLDGGRRGWALATLPSAEFEIAGAPIKPYLLLSTSHDLTRAIRALFTATYVVCNNTETAALRDAGVTPGKTPKYLPNVLTVRHTVNVRERLAMATALVARAREYFGAFHEVALRLVHQRFTLSEMGALASQLFPIPDNLTKRDEIEASGAYKAQAKVVSLFAGEAKTARQAPGTRWTALNSVSEFIDHHQRRVSAESRFDSILFGHGAALRQQAMDLLLAA